MSRHQQSQHEAEVERLVAYGRALAASAPPLTQAQRDRLATIIETADEIERRESA